MISLAPRRATSSSTSLRSRPEPNRASISPRIFSVGDTRDGTGVVLPVQTWSVLYGTYARRHLHRRMDTTPAGVRPLSLTGPSAVTAFTVAVVARSDAMKERGLRSS